MVRCYTLIGTTLATSVVFYANGRIGMNGNTLSRREATEWLCRFRELRAGQPGQYRIRREVWG